MLTYDFELRRRLDQAALPDQPVRWREVYQLGAQLAVFGFSEEAISLWRFLYLNEIPLPSPLYTGEYGDLIVSAVCHTLERPDVSHGRPASVHCNPGWTLRERVDAYERKVRLELTTDRWLPIALTTPDFPPLETLGDYRRALALARPHPRGEPPRREREAVELLDAYLESVDPDRRDPVRPPVTAINAALLAADISARHHQADEAKRFLNRWHHWGIRFPTNAPLEPAFGLRSVSTLFAAETLGDRTALRGEEVHVLVHAIISARRPLAAAEADEADDDYPTE